MDIEKASIHDLEAELETKIRECMENNGSDKVEGEDLMRTYRCPYLSQARILNSDVRCAYLSLYEGRAYCLRDARKNASKYELGR